MSDNPALSIVIVVTGRVALFRETLASVLAQDFKDIEIVVSDDTASEAERAEIRMAINEVTYLRPHLTIRYVFSEPRLGQAKNHNQGLEAARGRFIRILHGDDLLAPFALRCEMAVLEAFSGGVLCLFSDVYKFDKVFDYEPMGKVILESPRVLLQRLVPTSTALPSTLIFHRSIIDAGLRMDDTFHFLCDWKFFYEIVKYADTENLYIAHPEGRWVGWRQHADTVTSRLWLQHHDEHQLFFHRALLAEDMFRTRWDMTDAEVQEIHYRTFNYRTERLKSDFLQLPPPLREQHLLRMLSSMFSNLAFVRGGEKLFQSAFWQDIRASAESTPIKVAKDMIADFCRVATDQPYKATTIADFCARNSLASPT